MGELLTTILLAAIFAGFFAMMFTDALRVFKGDEYEEISIDYVAGRNVSASSNSKSKRDRSA